MKFTIEICAAGTDGADNVVRRFNITAINPSRALKQARAMLEDWKSFEALERIKRAIDEWARCETGHAEYFWDKPPSVG